MLPLTGPFQSHFGSNDQESRSRRSVRRDGPWQSCNVSVALRLQAPDSSARAVGCLSKLVNRRWACGVAGCAARASGRPVTRSVCIQGWPPTDRRSSTWPLRFMGPTPQWPACVVRSRRAWQRQPALTQKWRRRRQPGTQAAEAQAAETWSAHPDSVWNVSDREQRLQ